RVVGGGRNPPNTYAGRRLFSNPGFFRRVFMGVRHGVANHYPYPDRWFERRLFVELESRGYNYRDLNTAGECTLHYDVRDFAANLNMREGVPNWCFLFINWALERTGGSLSLKLRLVVGEQKKAPPPALSLPRLYSSGKRR